MKMHGICFVACPFAKEYWAFGNLVDVVEPEMLDVEGINEWIFKILSLLDEESDIGKFVNILETKKLIIYCGTILVRVLRSLLN